MPPLSYEKAVLRSFVPTWRESLILYFKNGTLDKQKNHSLAKSVGSSQRVDSDFQNGLAIISSGIDTNRLLFYLLIYIANPLHIYENDSFIADFNPSQLKSDSITDKSFKSITPTDRIHTINYNSSNVKTRGKKGEKRQKLDNFEISYRNETNEPNIIISDKSLIDSEMNLRINHQVDDDELYDLGVKNSNLVLKSRSFYRMIFSMSESETLPKFRNRMFLFNDLNVQSTVTIYSHLVFVLGFEVTDFENYETTYKYLTNKLFKDQERELTEVNQLNNNAEYCQINPGNSAQIVLPKLVFIDGSVISSSRQQLYVNGGYFCINTRVLLNDILTSKILPEIIGGIVIMNAHQIAEDCNIPFVIRLLRMRNKVAFVKAVSNNVHFFKGNNLSYCLKNIFSKNVYLFPRCHHAIEAVLNDTQVQPLTFEVSFPLSDTASEAYNSILKIIWTIVQSMKRLKYDIDMNKIVYTTNKLLIRLLRKQSKSTKVYQSTAPQANKTKFNSSDFYIDTLLKFRRLLDHLLFTDPITFLEELDNIITENSNWVCTPNGIKLFKKSNERLFKIENDKIELNIENNLKVEYLMNILKTDITNDQLVQIIKSNFKRYKIYNRVPNKLYNQFYIRNYLDKLKTKRKYLNLSIARRRLVRLERNHLRFFNKYFNSGKKLKRNVLIVVENFYLVDYLTKYFKYPEYHLTKLMKYLQHSLYTANTSMTKDTSSFINEYYSNINKKILNKSNVYNLYKILLRQLEQSNLNPDILKLDNNNDENNDTTNNTNDTINKTNETNHHNHTNTNNDNDNDDDVEEMEEDYKSESEDENEVFSIINEKAIDVNELMNYIDIKLEFDQYVENSLYIVKSYSNISSSRMDKYDRLMTTLMNVNPCIILIYSPNVHVFRTIENYCAHKFARGDLRRKKMNFLQVHVLSYKDCLETHRFAKCLKSEVDAWASLQTEKKTQVIRLDEGILLNRASLIGQVIVDSREMHCKLPFYLFNLGINVVPNVLEIGDYLITRDICIERKSIIDLHISLNNARLSKQISEMCSAYNNPFLLIEFEEEDLFHLPSTGYTKGGYNYIYIKLIILCCNFPKLRLIWSSSPKHSANIIKYLKANRTEPDLINNDYLIKNFRNKSEKLENRPELNSTEKDDATDIKSECVNAKSENVKTENVCQSVKPEDIFKAKSENTEGTVDSKSGTCEDTSNDKAEDTDVSNAETKPDGVCENTVDTNVEDTNETNETNECNETNEINESNKTDTTDENVNNVSENKAENTSENTVETVNSEGNDTKPEDMIEPGVENVNESNEFDEFSKTIETKESDKTNENNESNNINESIIENINIELDADESSNAEKTDENVLNNETKEPDNVVEGNNLEKTVNEGKEKVIGLKRPEFVKNRDALKILRNIPGVTSHNISQILTRVS
uniref:DNA repair (RAD6) endonuclease, putative n=1 Tax=Theileria annulata TaxID=5874 RepID=A0A3B0N125_THEAN